MWSPGHGGEHKTDRLHWRCLLTGQDEQEVPAAGGLGETHVSHRVGDNLYGDSWTCHFGKDFGCPGVGMSSHPFQIKGQIAVSCNFYHEEENTSTLQKKKSSPMWGLIWSWVPRWGLPLRDWGSFLGRKGHVLKHHSRWESCVWTFRLCLPEPRFLGEVLRKSVWALAGHVWMLELRWWHAAWPAANVSVVGLSSPEFSEYKKHFKCQ